MYYHQSLTILLALLVNAFTDKANHIQRYLG